MDEWDVGLDDRLTKQERQVMHPLEINDKLAFETIRTVRLDFLTEEAKAPIPRCQDLPLYAFSRLTGRSILVAFSHGWFFQTHPDPNGEKLDSIRNVFAPRLRERYPDTDIQVFFDFLASPQRPRTKEEDKIFAVAMDRMNSMYVYADVIVFLEVQLPKLDMTTHSAEIDLTTYRFFDFVDTIQVSETKSKAGPQQFDCIQTCDSNKVDSASQLNSLSDTHTLTYLHRPYGRPNTIMNDDRGWLFLERITIAVKAAAADKSQFDDIVVSNSQKLRTQIFVWTEQLREAARKQKTKPRALRDLLENFDKELKSKQFSFSSDESIVRELMTKLINQFADDWNGEVEKQKSMSNRARDILLRWGCFSEMYVKKAGLICDDDSEFEGKNWYFRMLLVVIVAPMLASLPFVFSLEFSDADDPSTNRESLLASSIWIGCVSSYMTVLLLHALNFVFAKVSVGTHSALAVLFVALVAIPLSCCLRIITGSIVAFEAVFVGAVGFLLTDILYGMLKVIPVNIQGKTKMYNIGSWLHMPASCRFDLKTRANVKRVLHTSQFTAVFGLAYPLLGGLFFQSSTIVQAALIPVFFIWRAGFEYGCDVITSHTFGSDGMPVINFMGVLMHEVCLSVMITSIKHPLVFVSLVLSDVVENSFCLWSLARNAKPRTTTKVSPDITEDNETSVEPKQRRSLVRRSTTVVSLVRDGENVSDENTALFIASILLQREMVETVVPIQAMGILSFLYNLDVKSNAIVSDWSEKDWVQSMAYIGIDLFVELVVFTCTICVLKIIYVF